MDKLYNLYGSQGREMALEILEEVPLELSSNMKVGIKPNLALAKESQSGATTDPELVAGVIEYLQAQGIEDIIIIESSWVGDKTKRAFKVCGYEDLANQYGVRLYDLKDDSFQTYVSGDLEIKVCQKPLEVDYLINMPVLKAHCQTKITCALKNLKGCIPDSEKRRFHTLDLHKPIAHLNQILRSDLIVVDGIIGDLTFEEGGNPVRMNRVLVGKDSVLIDAFVAQLLGFDIDEIPYIKIAEELGLGSTDSTSAEIKYLNNSKDLIQEENKLVDTDINARKVERLAQYIVEKEACSACYGSLIHALQRIDDKYGLPKDTQVYIGQGWQEESISGIGIGRCTGQAKDHISGCPPEAKRIVDKLIEIWGLD
ncbi:MULTISPECIES: DUF362 domain-containing protein [unclassified Candidatus Frackibacter]|uniref:DUF362 domain-containing protein n=1 Tax=unclassified Candidatus Frackibacter TaxID=2648818 RepID=UPI00088457D2|nr:MULTISPECIES: DUF362 domain-containing protein [unclassified Candidatus Frackibacter]SDC36751.1 Uncharacterized conserved protein, DUF362 family [Candidatus Frackibacter sp. WG11]SEM63175.1 Uncharacterized conserved protein, DUF362 family [Candidatus Frackibacter sp. WG12]SFL64502.1 Uncharacterized conserved protein, DUF362 family [Candidatus Frackibacter sp. WG13]